MKNSLLALLTFFLFVTGCGRRTTTVMHSANGGKKSGGRYTLNEIRGNPASLDPVRMNSKLEDDIGGQIFDKLLDNNESLQLVPELASSYEVAADGKTYTFHLRSDATFHDDPCFAN